MSVFAHLFVVSVVAVVSLSTFSGCCRRWGSSSGSSSSSNPSPGATDYTVRMVNARVQFDSPAGWTRIDKGSGWTQFMAPDKYASLAFVTFDKPGESTQRIGQMAGILNIDNIAWAGGQTSVTLGRGAFPSKIGEGTCRIGGGDPCYVWYATVNPGTPTQVLIVYAVNTKVGSHHRENAKAAVDSLRPL